MEQQQAADLIRNGVGQTAVQHWADLGCGSGTFTSALAGLLLSGSRIMAIDKERQRFPAEIGGVKVDFSKLNFDKDPLNLIGLDGILMANSLHYIKNKPALLMKLEHCFLDKRRFIIVEYENRRANLWVPYPIAFTELISLGDAHGYHTMKLNEVPSRFGGSMYSALLSS